MVFFKTRPNSSSLYIFQSIFELQPFKFDDYDEGGVTVKGSNYNIIYKK